MFSESVVWCRSAEDDLYRSVISGHEEKHKQLIVENHDLRETLAYLLSELSTLAHRRSQSHTADHHSDEVFIIVVSIIDVGVCSRK